jgi:hypothetical protein
VHKISETVRAAGKGFALKPISKYLFALSQFFMIWAATVSFRKGEVFLGILDLISFVLLSLVTLISWKTFTNT